MPISKFGNWFDIFVPKKRIWYREVGVGGRDEVLRKAVFENHGKSAW